MTWKRLRHMIVVAAVAAGYCGWLIAAGSASTHLSLVKVAYLYNFAKFIEWPPEALGDAHASFVICMLGTGMSEGAMPTLQGKSLRGKKVTVKYFAQATNVKPGACHILFVITSERDRVRRIITRMAKQPVLTVGDAEGFARQGGMINFITQQNKTRFAINVDAAQRAGLRIRSKLLKLGKIVEETR